MPKIRNQLLTSTQKMPFLGLIKAKEAMIQLKASDRHVLGKKAAAWSAIRQEFTGMNPDIGQWPS